MNSYTTKKLAEEGAEVAQAGLKVLLHHDRPAMDDFVGEMADVQALIILGVKTLSRRHQTMFAEHVAARVQREQKKGKIG